MRPEPRLTPDAKADALHAVEHYNAQRPALGFEFLDELEHVTSAIREAPLMFPLVDPPIRRALLRRFPYGVFYAPGASDGSDVVVAIVDLRQDPEVIRRAYAR
jgi:plasmid stabilization system protein ParE